jgi:hypothetical protein
MSAEAEARAKAEQAQAQVAQVQQAVAGFSPDELKKMLATVTSFTQTLNAGSATFFNQISCQKGTDCYKAKRAEHLKKTMDAAQVNLVEAPFDLSSAEKNYYEFNTGENGGKEIYNKLIIDRFATTAAQFRANSIEKQQEFMTVLLQNIKQYEGETLLLKREKELVKIRQRENEKIMKLVNKYETILQTSQRKVVYENKNMDNLYAYRHVMLFIYYSIIVGYILFGNFIPEQMYKKSYVWLMLIIAVIFPIILNLIMKWIFILADAVSYWYADIPHKDVFKDL